MSKKRKAFLPKKIAGVKVPKKVRKGPFGELLASPTGQKAIIAAIASADPRKARASDETKVRRAAKAARDRRSFSQGEQTAAYAGFAADQTPAESSETPPATTGLTPL